MSDFSFSEEAIRLKFKAAFDEMADTKPFANDIAFHMTDWMEDLDYLIKTYSNIDNLSNDEITSFVYKFLSHVPNHLNAATKLSGLGKIKDVFEVGIFEDDF